MSHQKLIVLIIGISFCSIQCSIIPLKCPENEKFTQCAPEKVATCETKQASGPWKCPLGGQCVCADEWLVRNEKGVCVPIYNCPNICSENKKFQGCKPMITAEEKLTPLRILMLCQPKCICKESYWWNYTTKQCIAKKNLPRPSHPFHGMKG